MAAPDMMTIDDWLLSPDNKPGTGVSASIEAVAATVLDWPALQGFNPGAQDGQNEAVLQCLYELQQGLIRLSGLSHAALMPGSKPIAASALLALADRYHQHAGGRLTDVYLAGEIDDSLLTAAQGRRLQIRQFDGVTLSGIVPDAAAIVLPLSKLYGDHVDLTGLHNWRERGGIVLVDGLNQYLLPWPHDGHDFPVDALLLDQSLLFDVPDASAALLAADRLEPYLPTPMITQAGTRYQAQNAAQRPMSIGPQLPGLGALDSLFQCFTALMLRGVGGIQRRALSAVVANRFIIARLDAHESVGMAADICAFYEQVLEMPANESALAAVLTDINGYGARAERIGSMHDSAIQIVLRGLADVEPDAIMMLADQLRVVGAKPVQPLPRVSHGI